MAAFDKMGEILIRTARDRRAARGVDIEAKAEHKRGCC
jgi:hypothetical protein